MIYREKLMADAEKWEKLLFASSIRRLEEEYGRTEQRNAVKRSFTELFRQWGEQTEQKAASLGICYLYSSILMRTGEMRLTLYGKELYFDKNQVENTWYLPGFFQIYEQDMTEIMDRLRKAHPRIYRYEEEAVRCQYAEYYYAAIAALCRDMADEIRDSDEFKMMQKTEDFFFFFGRWRGEAQKL
ncbi:MAG: hypothetical protein J6D08_13315 [Lachnospiraceae bacterium]|nr:hypothetical protein [Lachnospiraceae bacterium]